MATLEQIEAKMKRLQTQADALITKRSSEVIANIRALMSKHGLTIADVDAHLGGKKRGPKTGTGSADTAKVHATKYRDPKTGATWSGRGRAPGWIAGAKDRTRYLAKGDASSTTPATANRTKLNGNYVRGPQPAKYRDPQSNATWSGRGRAPAWLAGVKDRTRFLIDVATIDSPRAEVPVEKAGVKKHRSK